MSFVRVLYPSSSDTSEFARPLFDKLSSARQSLIDIGAGDGTQTRDLMITNSFPRFSWEKLISVTECHRPIVTEIFANTVFKAETH